MATVRPASTVRDDLRSAGCEAWEAVGRPAAPQSSKALMGCIEGEHARDLVRQDEDGCEKSIERLWGAGLEALDLLGIGLVVCEPSSRVLASNRTADDILLAREGLQLNAAGELCITRQSTPALERLFNRTVHAAELGGAGRPRSAVSVSRGFRKRPLILYVRLVEAQCSQCGPIHPAVLVMILDSTTPVKSSEIELYQLYGFTSTEARMANLLMDGNTLNECCGQLGIRYSTGCTHLKRLFKKTGVHRQTQLVSLLLKSIGLVRLRKIPAI